MLFVVATPLGNLADISPRALQCLKDADVILAEDTRRTRQLLQHFGIQNQLQSFYQHNEAYKLDKVLALLAEDKKIVLVSDAGTPAISDPGALLVEQALLHQYKVTAIPGPSAMSTALSVSGFFGSAWFLGFLPTDNKDRNAILDKLIFFEGIAVLFEAPHRLLKTLQQLADIMPERAACVCRELTKLHEEIRRDTLPALAEWAASKEILGEITLVLGPLPKKEIAVEDEKIIEALKRCLQQGFSVRDAVQAVATVLEISKRHVYHLSTQVSIAKNSR